MILNFFESGLLKGKRVILIANNPKLIGNQNGGDKALECNVNDIVIRFAGDKYCLMKRSNFCKGRCDIMVYRSGKEYFNAFDWHNACKGDKQLFLIYNTKNAKSKINEFKDDEIKITLMKQIKRCPVESRYIGFISDILGGSPTQGFGLLLRLLGSCKCKEIVLCGFTNLTKKVRVNERYGIHNIYNENMIFNKYIMKNDKYKNIISKFRC